MNQGALYDCRGILAVWSWPAKSVAERPREFESRPRRLIMLGGLSRPKMCTGWKLAMMPPLSQQNLGCEGKHGGGREFDPRPAHHFTLVFVIWFS